MSRIAENKGKHILVDYTNFTGDEYRLGEFIYEVLKNAVATTSMKSVHTHLAILSGDTPPGFTCVILLDESHITAHCYSETGLLALDCFTCGSTDTEKVMDYIEAKIKYRFPLVKCTYRQTHKRFNH